MRRKPSIVQRRPRGGTRSPGRTAAIAPRFLCQRVCYSVPPHRRSTKKTLPRALCSALLGPCCGATATYRLCVFSPRSGRVLSSVRRYCGVISRGRKLRIALHSANQRARTYCRYFGHLVISQIVISATCPAPFLQSRKNSKLKVRGRDCACIVVI